MLEFASLVISELIAMNPRLVLILGLAITLCTSCSAQSSRSAEPTIETNPVSSTAAQSAPILIDIEGQPMVGDPAAKAVVVEFLDYQCPVCARQARDIMPQLQTNYIDTGKVAYVFMDFPIESFHPLAFQAAEAVNCAADQGQFLAMHDLLLSRQDALQEADLYTHAASLSLDISAFQDCMVTNQHADAIRHDIEQGIASGLTGTPTLFLGVPETGQAGRVRVVSIIRGVGAYPSFSQKLEKVLVSGQ
jgi:protein-disulfide isomerase